MKCKFIFVFILVMIISACSGSDNPTPSIKNPPIISLFQAVPDTIDLGQSSQLTWSITGATTVELSGFGQVGQVDSRNATPTDTTTYVLTAINADGPTTKSVTVTVNKKAVFVFTGTQKLMYSGYCLYEVTAKNTGNGSCHNLVGTAYAYDQSAILKQTCTSSFAGDAAPGDSITFRFLFTYFTKWSRIGVVLYRLDWVNNTGIHFEQTGTLSE